MKRRIWLPDGLYQWLPWTALVVGGAGVLLIDGQSLTMITLSFVVFCYGVGVLKVRNDANRMPAAEWSGKEGGHV